MPQGPGSIRYRASLEPLFVLLASVAVLALYDRVRGPQLAPAVAVATSPGRAAPTADGWRG